MAMIDGKCVAIEKTAFYEIEQNLDFRSATTFKFFVRFIDSITLQPVVLSKAPSDLIKVSTKEQNLLASENTLAATSSQGVYELTVIFQTYAIPANSKNIELYFETQEIASYLEPSILPEPVGAVGQSLTSLTGVYEEYQTEIVSVTVNRRIRILQDD